MIRFAATIACGFKSQDIYRISTDFSTGKPLNVLDNIFGPRIFGGTKWEKVAIDVVRW